ncbi:multidrug resistance protein [Scheffersomyces xylosifermentans]|uniref:multidrug resistance protein n=1 Tax=Scheffersomyces xylosifermentans TaxID=1304137 RepID=UPI00315DC978
MIEKDTHSDRSESSWNEYHGFSEETEGNVQELARIMTITSNKGMVDDANSENLMKYLTHMSEVPGENPFLDPTTYPELDPNSPTFSAKAWIKNLRKLHDSDPEYYKPSKLGIAYRNLRAYGLLSSADYQPTVLDALWKQFENAKTALRKKDPANYFDILKSMDALMKPGEVTVVLGRPGSGCSTLLKTIAAETYGFDIGEESKIVYDGLTPEEIRNNYRGNVIYSSESDIHFPHLTVGDTLEFASRLSTPQNRGDGVEREAYAKHIADVYMATYGLSHTRNTMVGNEFVRGVSGGERKRVSIAEVSIAGANLQCWDNSTRGLDAATALEFIRALKTSATILETTPIIAIYQCSQDAYDYFDKVIVLYEGYQIYFGRADEAKDYFINMGWECPQRETTADFLTSLTNPSERIARKGFEMKVPQTAKEFEMFWKNSSEYKKLVCDIDNHIQEAELDESRKLHLEAHISKQSNHVSQSSPYKVSFFMQVRYIMGRNLLLVKANPSITIISIFSQLLMGTVLSSVFYNQKETTSSFNYRSAAMFFSLLFNAFASLLEILSLFGARPVVEKHKKYALYRPSADALSSIITELPTKLMMSVGFNFVYYFMVNFRRTPGNFFFYWLMMLWCTLFMSHLFRSLAAVATSIANAMTPASVVLMAMIIYAGFIIPIPYMLGWSRWINYLNPLGYVFESLMLNEFHNREFECSTFVPSGPGYESISNSARVCSTVGSRPGISTVNGTAYLTEAYRYYISHKWRNFGIIVAFAIVFLFVYIALIEYSNGSMQKGEIALFLRGTLRRQRKEAEKQKPAVLDIENTFTAESIKYEDAAEANYNSGTANQKFITSNRTFHWRDIEYSVKIKSEGERIILNEVDGWVKPGQLTALMGSSGAGKTTLLNCLSGRLTTGVISDGVRMVNGHPLDSAFQRSIGYAQQQDIHLPNSTVREALQFAAYLRQPNSVSKKEKDDYVEYIIGLLEMFGYADALVGVAGEGLNVEQRKRLTIGVELVAKPDLLLFLDEPTSGLDSQTAWSICKLLRKLADHGQAILCTIHQPSALLLQEFDRLLFLQKGGQTVYFGDLGDNCSTLINYFEKYGSQPCPPDANPAEWMLEVVGAAPGSHAKQDYFEVWKNSTEYQEVRSELEQMELELVKLPKPDTADAHLKYAAPIWKQYLIVSTRGIISKWRNPNYIFSKLLLIVASSLLSGFSFFKADNSMRGLQNQMFAIFMLFLPHNTIVDQLLPYFVSEREVYEAKEAPSRTFSWVAFIGGQITSEIPYQVVVGTLSFFSWYYPVGLYANAVESHAVHERGALMWLLMTFFFIFSSTFGQLCISFNDLEENAANLSFVCFTLCMLFCGVLVTKDSLPGFWIFMYRCNPLTYLIQASLSAGLANTTVVCKPEELVSFLAPSGTTCAAFMGDYIKIAGGYLLEPDSTSECSYCSMKYTNDFLTSVDSIYSERWRNFGIFICFIAANIGLSFFLYWLSRVPKGTREKRKIAK